MTGIIMRVPGVPVSIEDNSRQISPPRSMLTRYFNFQPSGSSGAHFLWLKSDGNYPEGSWGASEH